MMPVLRITRWQGINHATLLLPIARPTARFASGWPIACAIA
jgi:hypothetical protein